MAGHCEHGNGPSDSIKGREFLEQVRNYYRLKKNSVPRSSLVGGRLNSYLRIPNKQGIADNGDKLLHSAN
jgi:hypothetical protein